MIFLWLYLNAAPFLTQTLPNSQFLYSSPYTAITNAENLSSYLIKSDIIAIQSPSLVVFPAS